MIRLFSDYIFSDSLRYEGHKLVYCPDNREPIILSGMLAAGIMASLLSVTEEGEARGLQLLTPEGRKDFFMRYEQEMLADNGGLLKTELQALSDAYMEFTGEEELLLHICRNDRLYDLAIGLTVEYMRYLVVEIFGEHIWNVHKWEKPFAQWLWNAARIETRRQRFLHIDWTNPIDVISLANMPDEGEMPTRIFEGEAAEDIMNRYYEWMWETYQKHAREIPGYKITAVDKKHIIKSESDWLFLADEINMYDEETQSAWRQWMTDWQDFLTRKMKPEKTITFWTKSVSEEKQEVLLDYIKMQERQPQRYKCLTVAVYSLRQLGYVNYNLATSPMAKWLSERLMNDYSSKTGLYQFRRAWNELSRYNPAVQDEVEHLNELGVEKISD